MIATTIPQIWDIQLNVYIESSIILSSYRERNIKLSFMACEGLKFAFAIVLEAEESANIFLDPSTLRYSISSTLPFSDSVHYIYIIANY